MAIDRTDWHSGQDFPKELPAENGGTHIGMYLAWIINNHLEGEIHHEDEDSKQAVARVRKREITGREFLASACDEKFWESDLNEEGLAFTKQYYVTTGGGTTLLISKITYTLSPRICPASTTSKTPGKTTTHSASVWTAGFGSGRLSRRGK
jgi:hypothetical protein